MKSSFKILITFTCLSILGTLYSQTVDTPYEVGIWQGFRTAAVSYTFDDGCPNQYTKAIPMFNEFDFKLTLFIVTGSEWQWPADWTALEEAALQGHEIASHTITHTSFIGMSDSMQTVELRDSQNEINAHIPGQKCVTMAYPFCNTANKSICSQYYIAARICSGSIVPSNPGDFLTLSSIICGSEGSVKKTKDFIYRAGLAVNSKGWCVFLFHGIDNDGGWSSIPSDTLRKSLEYFDANRDNFWVSTFANVAMYIKERNAVSVTESAVLDTSITVQVTDTLDNEIFNVPITLRRPLPEGWASATAKQSDQPVETRIIEVDTETYIMFDAIPDGGDVVLSKSEATDVRNHGSLMVPSPSLSQNSPNPFNPTTTIHFELIKTGQVSLKVFDILGREVRTLLDEERPAGQHSVVFKADGLESGVYFFSLREADFLQHRKMLLLR